jgi:hypothetical protein
MADTVFVGVKPTDVAIPGSRFRLALRRDVNLGAIGKEIFTFGFAESGLDAWAQIVSRFVDRCAGSSVAFPSGNASVNVDAGTAVVDIRLKSLLPGTGVTIAEVLRELERFHPGARVDRITRLGAENLEQVTMAREAELEAATDRAESDSFLARVERFLKGAALAVLIIAGLGLLIYAAYQRRQAAA